MRTWISLCCIASALVTNVPARAQNVAPAPAAGVPAAGETELILRTQQLLLEIGQYDGPVDGRMSEATAAAIKRFQDRRGLEPDGKVDRMLINMLEDAKKP